MMLRADLKSEGAQHTIEMGSSGLAQLPCLPIHDQQEIAPGHESEEIQKLSEFGEGRISSRDRDC